MGKSGGRLGVRSVLGTGSVLRDRSEELLLNRKLLPMWLQHIIRGVLKAFLFVFYRMKVTGLENIPKTGNVLICPNHVSNMDILFVGVKMNRLVRWMAKVELWNNKLLGSLIESLGAFPVRRGKGDVSAIRTSIDLIEAGEVVGIFAEGHRVKTSIKKGYKIHSGASMLAIKTCTPVIPVGIKGSGRMFGKVTVVFGEPFFIDADCSLDYKYADYVAFSREIMRKAYGLVGQKVFDERGLS